MTMTFNCEEDQQQRSSSSERLVERNNGSNDKIGLDITTTSFNNSNDRHPSSSSFSVPDAMDVSSIPSSSEDDDDDDLLLDDQDQEGGEGSDTFDSNSMKLPRISSSTIPLKIEIAERSDKFGSCDPLFQGRCLYSGSMSKDQVQQYISKTSIPTSTDNTAPTKSYNKETSWFLPSVLRHLLEVKRG